MHALPPRGGKESLLHRCLQLRSARAEQAWIDERIGAGIAGPHVAIVQYRTPAIIYRRQLHDDAVALARAARVGCDMLRRGSGGGEVLAGPWMLGMDLFLPAMHPLSRTSHVAGFRWLGDQWRRAFARVGMSVEIANALSIAEHNDAARAAGLDWVCFAGLSHGELLDGEGRKLLGLAQRRGRWGILLSSGLLLGETPWEILEFVRHGQRPARSRMRELASPGLASLAPALAVDRLCQCVLDELQRDLDGTHPTAMAAEELESVL
jgi:lipoate-protein ligase A